MQNEPILNFFAKYIENELGIVYSETNFFQLQNRLEEIRQLLGVTDLNALFEIGQKGISGNFKQLLLDLSTNNETSFFRDPKIFKAVENLVLDKVDKNKKLKIWSAASSAGQEALSISMMIHEWNIKQLSQIQFSIIATDISTRILEKAKSATYTQLEAQRGLPTQLLIKYFKKDDQDKWVAEKILRDHIEFKKLNLREYFSFPEPFDIIFCRNVLIYQSVPSKTEILSKITKQLVPQGVLVLGSGESLLGLSTDYEQLSSDGAVVYRKKS